MRIPPAGALAGMRTTLDDGAADDDAGVMVVGAGVGAGAGAGLGRG